MISIIDLFKEMRTRGLTTNMEDFSRRWVNRKPDYLHTVWKNPSLSVLVLLHARLMKTSHFDLAEAAHALMMAEVNARKAKATKAASAEEAQT